MLVEAGLSDHLRAIVNRMHAARAHSEYVVTNLAIALAVIACVCVALAYMRKPTQTPAQIHSQNMQRQKYVQDLIRQVDMNMGMLPSIVD